MLYRNVGMGNADLPARVWIGSPGAVPDTADALAPAAAVDVVDDALEDDLLVSAV